MANKIFFFFTFLSSILCFFVFVFFFSLFLCPLFIVCPMLFMMPKFLYFFTINYLLNVIYFVILLFATFKIRQLLLLTFSVKFLDVVLVNNKPCKFHFFLLVRRHTKLKMKKLSEQLNQPREILAPIVVRLQRLWTSSKERPVRHNERIHDFYYR